MGTSGYTTRKAAFKQLDAAIGNLDTAMDHLLQLKEVYQNNHPEIAEAAESIMIGVLYWQQVLSNFRHSF